MERNDYLAWAHGAARPLVGEPEIRLAQTDEVDAAHNLMLSTARWLEEKGAALWLSEELNAEDTRQCAARNELVLAVEGTSVVGIMRREWEDPVFWPEAKRGEAAYLHRLAVARTHAGTGLSQALVRWAIADARRRELAFLRHDCEPRPALIRFYSSLGFSRIDTFATGKFTVVRWQMDISLNQDKK